jgi:molecular chaperone HscB
VKYFEALGIRPQLSLDTAALQKRFYELSRQWHPDRFSTRPAAEQVQALETTALLNDAFRTLKDPITRAEYVLAGNGLEAATQRGRDVPPELLEEVLEFNMALEEADPAALDRWYAHFRDLLTQIDQELEGLFAAYDADPGPATLAPIRAALNKRKYISNLARDSERAPAV